jgi:citronellol/citronellal dehydrogenase
LVKIYFNQLINNFLNFKYNIVRADAAYEILTSDNKTTTGNFFIDDEVLASVGVVHLEKYNVNKDVKEKDLMPDYFC